MHDFLIVGGGINGLLVARELAHAGASVAVIDQGACGKEASWAGGGIISPLYPWRYDAPITALARWAQDFYPLLVQQLIEETGIDAQLNRTGLLMLDARDQQDALAWAHAVGSNMEVVDSNNVAAMEPKLAAGFHTGLWMRDVANVRNPRLIQALVASLVQSPLVDVIEHAEVEDLLIKQNRIQGVSVRRTGSSAVFSAGSTIICAGAWAGRILSKTGLTVPIEPVKGQMLLYRLPAPIIGNIVLTAGRYVIPRQDGHLLVGSTLERTGFDKSVTKPANEDLTTAAAALIPELSGSSPIAQWAGLRPAAPQGVPFIGRIPEVENLYINAGQFRNGLVLAPASARLTGDIVLDRQSIVDPLPYAPETRLLAGR